jgi:hypothetical protein
MNACINTGTDIYIYTHIYTPLYPQRWVGLGNDTKVSVPPSVVHTIFRNIVLPKQLHQHPFQKTEIKRREEEVGEEIIANQ